MGRLLLLTVGVLVGVAACAPEEVAIRTRSPEDPHGALTCATCHSGGITEREVDGVPRGACTASGCHEDGGPARVTVARVDFEHRSHGGGEPVEMACAGCHSHPDGETPLTGGTGSCGFCHAEELDGSEPADCRACHALPSHVATTSQGVEVPHQGMPWIEGACVRCHYDVSGERGEVQARTCVGCHRDLEALAARSVGEDLHPDHTGVSCVACHGEGSHRIVAMSSAVELECRHCHTRSHGVDLAGGGSDGVDPGASSAAPAALAGGGPGGVATVTGATCDGCHREVHAEEQRLVLGALPGGGEPRPSAKFLDGLTCRSCHVTERRSPEGEILRVGGGVSCVGCHQPGYETVLRWWEEGTRARLRSVERHVDRVDASVGGSAAASVREALDEARDGVALVRAAGGQHNLPLTHALLGTILDAADRAARESGSTPPLRPDLGTPPRMGQCSYCHYRVDDPMRFREMDERFHREALGVSPEGGAR